MEYIALTGISSQVLRELQENRIRTIEIHSPHNFYSIHSAEIGDVIFVTGISYSDIKIGTIGLIARINRRQIAMHRTIVKSDEICEEYETFAARLQLELGGVGRVRKVKDIMIGKPCIVDINEGTYLEAK